MEPGGDGHIVDPGHAPSRPPELALHEFAAGHQRARRAELA
jgi:hypothetical protein